jgi:hypothetical protein
MAKGNKVKMADLKQTHGALSAPVSIEELTGQHEVYAVSTIEEYRNLLESMTEDDMREHAIVAGVVPIDNRSILIDRLETKFVNASRRTPPSVTQKISKKDQEFQRKFLEGRG